MNEQIGNSQIQKAKNEYFKLQTDEMQELDKTLQEKQTIGQYGITEKKNRLNRLYSFQESYDEELIDKMQGQTSRVLVKRSAPEGPGPQPGGEPGEESKKQRRERHRITDESSKKVKEIRASLHLSISPEIRKSAKQKGFDPRTLNCMCSSFDLDGNGKPLTELDRDALALNQQRLHDYVLGDKDAHERVLRELTDEFLSARIDLSILKDPQEMLKHMTYLDRMSDMAVYFENIMKDNKAYFDTLDEQTREKIELRFDMLSKSRIPQRLNDTLGAYNINLGTGNLQDPDADSELVMQTKRDTEQSLKNGEKGMFAAVFDYKNNLAAMNILQTTKQQRLELDQKNRQLMGVSFPGGAAEQDYVKVKKCRDRFLEHPETYAGSKKLLDSSFTEYYRVTAERVEKTRQIDALTSVIETLEKKAPASGSEEALRKKAAEEKRAELMKEETLLNNFLEGLDTMMEHVLGGTELSEEDEKYGFYMQIDTKTNDTRSWTAADRMKQNHDSQNYALTPEFAKRAKEKGVYVRALDVYSQPFQTTREGQPRSDDDRMRLEENRAFVESYAFGTKEERKQCLDRMVRMALDAHFEPNMFDDPEEALTHLPEYFLMEGRTVFLDDFKGQNKDYFDALDEQTKTRLQKLQDASTYFGMTITSLAKLYNIEPGLNVYRKSDVKDSTSGKLSTYEEYLQNSKAFRDSLGG